MYFDGVVLFTSPCGAVSHAACALLSLVLLHPAWVCDTWNTQIAPPSLSTFTHFPSLPSHVEQGRAVAVAGIRHVSPPSRPSLRCRYTCIRTIQLSCA